MRHTTETALPDASIQMVSRITVPDAGIRMLSRITLPDAGIQMVSRITVPDAGIQMRSRITLPDAGIFFECNIYIYIYIYVYSILEQWFAKTSDCDALLILSHGICTPRHATDTLHSIKCLQCFSNFARCLATLTSNPSNAAARSFSIFFNKHFFIKPGLQFAHPFTISRHFVHPYGGDVLNVFACLFGFAAAFGFVLLLGFLTFVLSFLPFTLWL